MPVPTVTKRSTGCSRRRCSRSRRPCSASTNGPPASEAPLARQRALEAGAAGERVHHRTEPAPAHLRCGILDRPGVVADELRAHALTAAGDHRLTTGCTEGRSEEHTSELQSRGHLVCRLLLEKKKQQEQKKNDQQDIIYLLFK